MDTTRTNEAAGRELAVGDRVRYSVKWLRSTGQYTGALPHAKGTITAIQPGKGFTLATIDWGKGADDVPAKVNVANLVHEEDVKFEDGKACYLCGSVLHEDGFGQPEWLASGHVFTLKHDGVDYAAFASSIEEARDLTALAVETADENLPVVRVDEQLITALRKLTRDDKVAVIEGSTEVARKLRHPKVSDENPFEEERDPCDPYEIWLKRDGAKLYVLKKYQKTCMEPPDLTICPACLPDLVTGMNPNAKWLIYDPETEKKSDMFVRDVIFNAVKIKDFPFQREHTIDAEIIKAVKAYNDYGSNSARMTVRLLGNEYTLFLGDNPVMNGTADEVKARIAELLKACLPDVDGAKDAQMANQAQLAKMTEAIEDVRWGKEQEVTLGRWSRGASFSFGRPAPGTHALIIGEERYATDYDPWGKDKVHPVDLPGRKAIVRFDTNKDNIPAVEVIRLIDSGVKKVSESEHAEQKRLHMAMSGKTDEAHRECNHEKMKLEHRKDKHGQEYRYVCDACSAPLSNWHTSQERARQGVQDREADIAFQKHAKEMGRDHVELDAAGNPKNEASQAGERYVPRKDGDYYYVYDTVQKSWDHIPLVNLQTAKKYAALMNHDAQQAKSAGNAPTADEATNQEKAQALGYKPKETRSTEPAARPEVDMDAKTAVIPPGYGYWEVDMNNFRRAQAPVNVERVQLHKGKYYGYVGTKQIWFTI